MQQDPIADMLIRIKNAGNAGRDRAHIPFSQMKFEVAKALQKEGYVKNAAPKGKKVQKTIEIEIAYSEGQKPRIQGLVRLSKPSRRLYYNVANIKPVRNGYGTLMLSTPKGILSGEDAKKAHVGGEALFQIW